MRVAAIYDIHGNLPALEAVLDEIDSLRVDEILVGGDVLPGPMPRETLERLVGLGLPTRFLRGNGDREVLARMEGTETEWFRAAAEAWREPVRWSARQLGPEHRRLLAGWHATCRSEIDGLGEVLFCHATPRSDSEIVTLRTPEDRLASILGDVEAAVVVCGHTHMQFERRIGPVRVINAGSVGMPFGRPGAYWTLLGPGVELRCTPYDFTRAAERLRGTKYPQAELFAERSVLRPPSEEEVLEMYSRAESS